MIILSSKFLKKSAKSFLIIFVSLILSLSIPFQVKAIGIGPFGGTILSVFPCTSGLSIIIGPPVGGKFFLTAGAIIYQFGQIRPGAWVLGMAAGPATCYYWSGDDLKSFSSGSNILFLGTSF